jgi:hypothetical protein
MRTPPAGRRNSLLSWASPLRWSAVAALTVLATVLGAFLLVNDDDGGTPRAGEPAPVSSESTPTTALISPDDVDERQAVAARVTEIFALQDRAFRNRDESLLGAIFAADCPCLRAGRERIRQLRADRLRWVGYRSRVSIGRVERTADRAWSVTAVLSGARTRVETDERELLRILPAGRGRWTFILTQPTGDGPLLLRSAKAAP